MLSIFLTCILQRGECIGKHREAESYFREASSGAYVRRRDLCKVRFLLCCATESLIELVYVCVCTCMIVSAVVVIVYIVCKCGGMAVSY